MEKLTAYFDTYLDKGINYAPKLLLALIALVIGFWIANAVTGVLRKKMDKSMVDKDVQPFLSSLINVGIKIMVLISVASMVGIKTTSFIAVLGAATLAIGMALQGSLGNLASGVMILIFKPYRVGDLIDLQGQLGHVEEIQIFNTIITTLDHKRVIIPNAVATSGTITNLTTKEWLRVDLNVHIPYERDFEEVRGIIMGAINETPKVMQDPEPYVEIETFDENGLKLCVRPHARTEDYWDVYFGVYRNVKAALGKAGIEVPYPRKIQMP